MEYFKIIGEFAYSFVKTTRICRNIFKSLEIGVKSTSRPWVVWNMSESVCKLRICMWNISRFRGNKFNTCRKLAVNFASRSCACHLFGRILYLFFFVCESSASLWYTFSKCGKLAVQFASRPSACHLFGRILKIEFFIQNYELKDQRIYFNFLQGN